MMPNNDDFRNIYDNLATDGADTWDIYAGENAQAAAEEKGVPADKWEQDRVRMQMGHEMMTEMLNEGIPEPASAEEEERLCDLISGLIDTRLCCLSDDTARKGMLLQAIVAGKAAGQEVDEEELAAMGLLDVNTLKAQLVDLTYSYTMDCVRPAILKQCELLMNDSEQAEEALRNPGALAVAAYMAAAGAKEDAAGEILSLQDMPEVAGAAAGLVEHINEESAKGTADAEILNSVAHGLLVLAAILALLLLAFIGVTLLLSIGFAAIYGTMGIGAAIIEALGVLPYLSGWIATILVSAGFGSLVVILAQHIKDEHNTSSHDSPPPTTGHIVTT